MPSAAVSLSPSLRSFLLLPRPRRPSVLFLSAEYALLIRPRRRVVVHSDVFAAASQRGRDGSIMRHFEKERMELMFD